MAEINMLRPCQRVLFGSSLRNLRCALLSGGSANLGFPTGASLHSLPGNRFLVPSSRRVVSESQIRKCVWFGPWKLSCLPQDQTRRWKSTRLADKKVSWGLGAAGIQELEDFTPLSDTNHKEGVTQQINSTLEKGEAGRLFAVVYIRGVQHKVTTGDVIMVKYDFPPKVGDQIRLEKVLTVGGKDFSLIGQPLLNRDVASVDATVVEKTLSHNRVWFVYRKRRNFNKFHLYREFFTKLVINNIQIAPLPDASKSAENEEKEGVDVE